MVDKIGMIFFWLGTILVILSFIIGAFLLHWIIGLVACGLVSLAFAGFLLME